MTYRLQKQRKRLVYAACKLRLRKLLKKVNSKKWLKIRISDGVNGCQRSFFGVRRLRIGYKLHGTVTRNIFLTVSFGE